VSFAAASKVIAVSFLLFMSMQIRIITVTTVFIITLTLICIITMAAILMFMTMVIFIVTPTSIFLLSHTIAAFIMVTVVTTLALGAVIMAGAAMAISRTTMLCNVGRGVKVTRILSRLGEHGMALIMRTYLII
jgi:hypothetical protein